MGGGAAGMIALVGMSVPSLAAELVAAATAADMAGDVKVRGVGGGGAVRREKW